MKKSLVVLVLGLFLVGGGVASAQFTNFFWNGHIDMPLPDSPCYVGSVVTDTSTFHINGELYVLYSCSDNRQWARKFFGVPVSTAPVVTTPTTSPTPGPIISCTTIQPGPDWSCVNGNWLPPGM